MESATQTLHRLTSDDRYDETRETEPPVDDPRVVQGFTPLDLGRLPWFYKRYRDGLPQIELPRRLAVTPGPPVRVPLTGGDPVDKVILRRGSQRLMDPTRPLSADLLRTALAAALRGIDVPHWVAVHHVTAVASGLYRSPDLATPVRTGDLRQEMYHACMDQGLGCDAAFVVIAATEIAATADRGYREAQLGAGLAEGRLHLAAYALGAAASGMTFVDGLIPRLLGQANMEGLLFTCIGVPEYRSKPGGPPGDPSAVQIVTPRF